MTKFNANGTQVLYSTYLGGSSFDSGNSIAVDNGGNAYITGGTSSTDFPTVNAKYPQLDSSDAFITKLSADGQRMIYSTYLGGGSGEIASDIAVDNAGNAYVTGYTDSSDFPTVNAKYPQLWGHYDAFVTKLSTDGQRVIYSTYLGGGKNGDNGRGEGGTGIAVDGAGNAYVTGWTFSDDFPTVNAKYPQLRGANDAFITKLSSDGQTVIYSTYLGGNDGEGYGDVLAGAGTRVAVDSIGNAYITGITSSADFPTVNAKYPQLRGIDDAFITKL